MGYKKESEVRVMLGASIKRKNKQLLKEFANKRGITEGKLASYIVEQWLLDARANRILDNNDIHIKDLFNLVELI